MFQRSRRRRRERRSRPGNGSALKDYRWWQLFHRTLFFLDLPDAGRGVSRYAVDVHHAGDEIDDTTSKGRAKTPPVGLYLDGVQVARAEPPVDLPVPGGRIEVAKGPYGLTRMHHVTQDGTERTLVPHPRSLEGRRARLGRHHPRLSRLIGAVAIAILLVGLVLAVPQVLELVTQIEPVAERFGTFRSPISLPAWANVTTIVLGVLAATERALTLRSHWLIDADTLWTSLV
jgi:hypothetical protein